MRFPTVLDPLIALLGFILHAIPAGSKEFFNSCQYPNVHPYWVDFQPPDSHVHLTLHAACRDKRGYQTFPVLDLSKCLVNIDARLVVRCLLPVFSDNARSDAFMAWV